MDLYLVYSYNAPPGQNLPRPGEGAGGHKLEHKNKERKIQDSFSLKLEGLKLWYSVYSFSLFVHMMPWGKIWPHPGAHKLEHRNKEAHFQKSSSLKLKGVEVDLYQVCSVVWKKNGFYGFTSMWWLGILNYGQIIKPPFARERYKYLTSTK